MATLSMPISASTLQFDQLGRAGRLAPGLPQRSPPMAPVGPRRTTRSTDFELWAQESIEDAKRFAGYTGEPMRRTSNPAANLAPATSKMPTRFPEMMQNTQTPTRELARLVERALAQPELAAGLFSPLASLERAAALAAVLSSPPGLEPPGMTMLPRAPEMPPMPFSLRKASTTGSEEAAGSGPGAAAQAGRKPISRSSEGTVGHPHTCGSPCKYSWKKSGCRAGESCLDCHECHWSRVLPARKPDSGEGKAKKGAAKSPTSATSGGTMGHPHSCASPCKFFRRLGGCWAGANCKDCHMCQWRRVKTTGDKADGQSEDDDNVSWSTNAEHCSEGSTQSMDVTHQQSWASAFEEAASDGLEQPLMCEECPPELPPPTLLRLSKTPLPDADATCPSVGSIGHPEACCEACKYQGKLRGCKNGRWCVRCHLCQWQGAKHHASGVDGEPMKVVLPPSPGR